MFTRVGVGMVVATGLLFGSHGALAEPMALHVSNGDLYEFDVMTGEYSLELTFDSPVRCHQLTRSGDSLFCAYANEFEGTLVRRLEPLSGTSGWQVNFLDLDFPDGIAFSDSLLYVVANTGQIRDFFLLTLDPTTGEELGRVQLPEELIRVDALAARGADLWLMTIGTFDGMAARRLDPLTGSLHESYLVSGVFGPSDADFGSDGRLFLSKWEWDIIHASWCTNYWIVPFLGGTPAHQFSHCWEDGSGPPPPTLANFTLADRGSAPVVEVPTLGAAAACVLAGLLAVIGILILRRVGNVSPA